MANPARDFRNKAQELWPGATVHGRGRNWIRHQHPTDPNKFMLDTSIGPVHYGASNDQEIDTAWQADTGAWQYKMTLAGYNAYARNILNVGDIIQYIHPGTGENVIFQPLGLNWVDNVTNSRQQLALPQAVTAIVDDDKLVWTDGYGTGRHFSWQTQTARLLKVLTIDSAANLPAPTVSNPYLEIEFITTYSSGLTIIIDGQTWNKRDRTTTANNIEFRDSGGNTLWYFHNPLAWDSSQPPESTTGLMQVERRGATQYVTVRWPKAWIDAAVFPIYLDTTVDEQVGADTDDATDAAGTYYPGAPGNIYMTVPGGKDDSGNAITGGYRFTTVNVPKDATIDTAKADWKSLLWSCDTTIHVKISADDTDDSVTFGAASLPSARTKTTAQVDWDGGNETGIDTVWYSATTYNKPPEIKSVIQEIVSRAGWAANNDLSIIVADDGSDTSSKFAGRDYTGSTSECAKLHIEYTAGGTTNITAAQNNQGQVSDAATLGVYTPATPSQQNQAQVSDLVSLSLATTALTAAENNQVQASDAASITAEGPTYQLSAAENNQAQVSDLATLGVFTPIAAAENNQAQTSDAATLGVYTPITAAEDNQAQVSDAVAFNSLVYPITAAECNQGQASDAASVSVQGATRWTTYWTTQFDQDQEVWVTLAHIAGIIRLWGRMVNPEGGGVNLRGYYAQYEGGMLSAYRYNDATATNEELGTYETTLVDSDKLWLRLEGAQVQVYVCHDSVWYKRIDVTDSSPALEDGYIGFDVTDSSAILDDFGGGALTVELTGAENNQAQVSDAASLTAEAPTVNITADDNNQAQVSDAASLTAEAPTYNITGAENNQAQVSDAASITAEAPTYNITAAENNQAQASDAVTFDSIVYALSPSQQNQAQKSDEATLTSGEVAVTPSQQNQAQVSDAVTLSVIYPFTGAENNQAQVSDAASITFSGIELVNITAGDNWQAQTSDAAVLGVWTPISPDDNNQGQASDAAVISASGPQWDITVADNWQAQAVDLPGLGVVYVINAADNYQTQVSDLAVLSLTGIFEHGERRLYQFEARGSSVFDARGTSVFATRADLEVDD